MPPEIDRRSLVKAFTASLTGTSLEWYDFAVYSAAAALVFPQLFFPDSDPLTGTLLAFSTYAVGYVSRPLGGFVFGRLGVVVGLALHSFMYGPQAAFVTEQFSTRLRYTGSSLAYTIAGVFGGAIAPLAFTALLGAWGTWVPVAIYVLVACSVTLAGLALGRNPDPAEDEDYLALVTPGGTTAA